MSATAHHLMATEITGAQLRLSLTWNTRDPYAATLTVLAVNEQPIPQPITWVFDWTLLEDGLHAMTGIGDVRVYPATPSRTAILLDNGVDRIVLHVANAELQAFLADTWVAEQSCPSFFPAEWVGES